jgi:hypothetical protein
VRIVALAPISKIESSCDASGGCLAIGTAYPLCERAHRQGAVRKGRCPSGTPPRYRRKELIEFAQSDLNLASITQSALRVSSISSRIANTRIVFSIIFDRANRALLLEASSSEEADASSMIVTSENECAALAAMQPATVPKGRKKVGLCGGGERNGC